MFGSLGFVVTHVSCVQAVPELQFLVLSDLWFSLRVLDPHLAPLFRILKPLLGGQIHAQPAENTIRIGFFKGLKFRPPQTEGVSAREVNCRYELDAFSGGEPGERGPLGNVVPQLTGLVHTVDPEGVDFLG